MLALDAESITSPKLRPTTQGSWYDYYAGYSAAFVQDVLQAVATEAPRPLRVLDPWNGSGTTTATAAKLGYETVGVDRNPALVLIAKGRHLAISSVDKSIDPLRAEVLGNARTLSAQLRRSPWEDDGLAQWFNAMTVARIRALERAIHRLLVDDSAGVRPSGPVTPAAVSPLAAFFYCALFTMVRQLTVPFRTTNPTWVRTAQDREALIDASWSDIDLHFNRDIQRLASRLTLSPPQADLPCTLYEGSAENLALDNPADLVVTSPPYCTRIDYVVATKPELAIMANTQDDLARLRLLMLGTPLTKDADASASDWGDTASTFMQRVTRHKSKAASTYYYRYYGAYMNRLWASLQAIDNSTRPEGTLAVVVQDSYFKEVHLDLPQIVAEMGDALSRPHSRINFPVATTKAAMHPGSRAYRTSFTAIESLVVLGEKEG